MSQLGVVFEATVPQAVGHGLEDGKGEVIETHHEALVFRAAGEPKGVGEGVHDEPIEVPLVDKRRLQVRGTLVRIIHRDRNQVAAARKPWRGIRRDVGDDTLDGLAAQQRRVPVQGRKHARVTGPQPRDVVSARVGGDVVCPGAGCVVKGAKEGGALRLRLSRDKGTECHQAVCGAPHCCRRGRRVLGAP